ncbi:hypothetical protein PVAND_012847 [Polypedilum vanderplanki]|uniref:MCM C-terminal AAA(+) ATPase domain-containing protein n=1 Tax=Polypedilum vanderplanki TaxID=319348 RepID=A0A9J6CPP7_POLVA|nr:hypothetical protein PVAND_012847 [Polypedilum vanderplanki]
MSNPRGRGGSGRAVGFKSKPVMTKSADENSEEFDINDGSFKIQKEKNCPYDEWKLYFPTQKFTESQKIAKIIIDMRKHFKTFAHWYDYDVIAETSAFHLKMDRLIDDKELDSNWPSWYQDFLNDPVNTLTAVGLAMHSVVSEFLKQKGESMKFYKRIFVRPIGWQPVTRLQNIENAAGKLVCTSGVVKCVETIEVHPKYICFQCTECSASLCVEQKSLDHITMPSSCIKNCDAKTNFITMMSSPFTVISPKQKIQIREISYQKDDNEVLLEVELTEDQVGSVSAGYQVLITGVLIYTSNISEAHQARNYKPHFQCHSIVCQQGMNFEMYKQIQNNVVPNIVYELENEQNIFKLLIQSFCKNIYRREEAKAAILLALLSGNELIQLGRSDSHVLLLGNPGTGKSNLLLQAVEISPRGVFVSGPMSTVAGLTVSVTGEGNVEAGALALANNGDCCIDELDKSRSIQKILLEAMEQQEISIAKCSALTTLAARCSVLASANPINSIYDQSKTVIQNVNFEPQLLSRFDLIVPFVENVQINNSHFISFMMRQSKDKASTSTSTSTSNLETGFFDSTANASQSSHRIKKIDPQENIKTLSTKELKDYINFVKHTFRPKLSSEAKKELRTFCKEHAILIKGNDELSSWGIGRFAQSMIRLALSRARAEMSEVATLEHAKDVIWLYKYNSVDIYNEYYQNAGNMNNSNPFGTIKRKTNTNVKALSKPKQMKAFLEYLEEKSEEEDRKEFTTKELKAFASEIGIKDFDDIITRLNYEGAILKTANGYRIPNI